MDADRERAYNAVDRRAVQNLDTAYRSRWTVNATGRRLPVDLLPVTFPVGAPTVERRAPVPPGGRLPIDLTPLMRLAQEACWGRFFNRPRHSAIADA